MNQEMAKLYSELVNQRKDHILRLDAIEDEHIEQEKTNKHVRSLWENIEFQRLRREVTWCESQVIALLGGTVHWEHND